MNLLNRICIIHYLTGGQLTCDMKEETYDDYRVRRATRWIGKVFIIHEELRIKKSMVKEIEILNK